MNLSPLILPVALAACAVQDSAGASVGFAPDYRGVETRSMASDLVNVRVEMTGARSDEDVEAYADCAAARYALIQGFGFARHLRTNVQQEAGVWRADAVYTISPSLPRGLKIIDAEVVKANCAENGIPTV